MLWKNQSIYKVVFPLFNTQAAFLMARNDIEFSQTWIRSHMVGKITILIWWFIMVTSVCGVWCVKSKRFMSHYQLLVRSVIENWWHPVIQNWWLSGARWTQNFFAVSFIFHRTKNVTTKNEKKGKNMNQCFVLLLCFHVKQFFECAVWSK